MLTRRISIALVCVVAAVLVFAAGYRLWLVRHTLNQLESQTMGATIGPVDSKNVVVDFMDYRCAACRLFNPTIEAFAKTHPDVKIVFRHFPLYLEPSIREASMAMAAAKQDKFLAMHDYLMSRIAAVDDKEVPDIAKQLQLDPDRLQKDMKKGDVGTQLTRTLDATWLLNIHSAPTFMINHTIYIVKGRLPSLNDVDALYDKNKR